MSAPERSNGLYGILAEFEGPKALLLAAERVRDAGYKRWDVHTPFPVHGMDAAMGLRPTILPWLVFGAGATGALGALLLQWWTNAFDYRFIISGKPFFGLPAAVPVAFELTILLASLAAFLGMLGLNRLPEWYHSLFNSERFRRVTTDGFFLSIEARDAAFDRKATAELLDSLGAVHVEEVED